MTRPADVPKDVWEAANKAMTGHYEFGNEQQAYPLRLDCARAILAERERCAKVAAEWPTTFVYGANIAAAIRQGDTP